MVCSRYRFCNCHGFKGSNPSHRCLRLPEARVGIGQALSRPRHVFERFGSRLPRKRSRERSRSQAWGCKLSHKWVVGTSGYGWSKLIVSASGMSEVWVVQACSGSLVSPLSVIATFLGIIV